MKASDNRVLLSILNRPSWLIALLFTAIAFVGIYFLTSHQINAIIDKEALTLRHRAQLLNGYLQSCTRIVDSMANTVQSAYNNESKMQSDPVAIEYLRDYPQYNTFGISAFSSEQGNDSLSSTLTAQGSIRRITSELRNEIVAALSLDSQLGTQTSQNSEFLWAYYTSAERFVILAPKVKVDDFQFTTDLYTKAYWTNAIPAANPELKTIISPLYEDAGGKGLMLTVSAPVVSKDKFLGVASIDLGIKTISRLLSTESSIGESLLVRTDGSIIARANAPTLNQHLLHIEDIGSAIVEHDHHWYITEAISNHDIVVTHQLDKKQVYLSAFRQSASSSIMLILTLGLLFTLLKLKHALINLTEVAHIDQLSSLLNRRGFRDSVEQIFTINGRIHAPWVILMLDIDHFKKINDGHGHETGDQIIIALSNLLKDNIRASDLVCRWGGEEFVIFLYNATLEDGITLAEKYRTEISATIKTPDDKPITVSIGIAQAAHQESIDKVIERSDHCLYFAKHTGRNRVSSKSTFTS